MKPKRMTDMELAEDVAEYRRLRASSKADEAIADEIAARIIVEMDARKKRVDVIAGVRVTVAKTRKIVSLEMARARLGPRKVKPFIREDINKKAWDVAIADGVLTADDTVACTVEQPVKPHIYANPVKDAAAA